MKNLRVLNMLFCTAISCMDGHVLLPVIEFLKNHLSIDYVDMVTEAGPVKILAEQQDSLTARSILQRIDISVNKQRSGVIAIAAHYDCAGNPVDEKTQKLQLQQSGKFLSSKNNSLQIIPVWINSSWQVKVVS